MIDCAIQPKKDGNCCNPCAPSAPDKPSYPNTCLTDAIAEAFEKQFGGVKVDQEFSLTVRVRVTGTNHNEYGKRIELALLEIEDGESEGESEEGDSAEEEKSEKYESPIDRMKAKRLKK